MKRRLWWLGIPVTCIAYFFGVGLLLTSMNWVPEAYAPVGGAALTYSLFLLLVALNIFWEKGRGGS